MLHLNGITLGWKSNLSNARHSKLPTLQKVKFPDETKASLTNILIHLFPPVSYTCR